MTYHVAIHCFLFISSSISAFIFSTLGPTSCNKASVTYHVAIHCFLFISSSISAFISKLGLLHVIKPLWLTKLLSTVSYSSPPSQPSFLHWVWLHHVIKPLWLTMLLSTVFYSSPPPSQLSSFPHWVQLPVIKPLWLTTLLSTVFYSSPPPSQPSFPNWVCFM